jgi:nucleotide-binding universal stress UspA family protein
VQGGLPMSKKNNASNPKEYRALVAIDFSQCSAHALKSSKLIMGRKPDKTYALHVIDHDFIEKCIDSGLGTESQIKKSLFVEARKKLKQFLQDQDMETDSIEMDICEGTPFLEINRKAIEKDVDIVILGTHGTSGDMTQIFFGSTTERVLRFIKRPVLCVPIEEDRKKD